MVVLTAVPAGCTTKPTCFGVPKVPVATNVALALPAAATTRFTPATVPRVQLVAAALPLASLVGLPVTVPPPAATEKVTATPEIGVPPESTTVTSGGLATLVLTTADKLSVVFVLFRVA